MHVSHILFISHYINKERKKHNWQGTNLVNVRTWVRFPGPPTLFNIFVHNAFRYNSLPRNHHTTPSLGTPHAPEDQSNGHHVKSTMDMSQHLHTLAREVKKGLKTLGQNCYNTPLNWGQTPLGLQHLFYFILFFILIQLFPFSNLIL